MGFVGNLSCAWAVTTLLAMPSIAANTNANRLMMFPFARPEASCFRASQRSTLRAILLVQINLDLSGDFFPVGDLALEPGLSFVERVAQLDTHELLREG